MCATTSIPWRPETLLSVEANGGVIFVVASGGDDNALGVTIIRYDPTVEDESIKVLSSAMVDSAAASAINEVWTDGSLVVATGWDQRVSMWELVRVSPKTDVGKGHGGAGAAKCQLAHLASSFVHVADCAALDVVVIGTETLDVVVAGQGLEMQRVCRSSAD